MTEVRHVTDLIEARSRLMFSIADIIERETCNNATIPCALCFAEARVLVEPFCNVLVSAARTAAGAGTEFKEETIVSFAAAKLRKYLNDTVNVGPPSKSHALTVLPTGHPYKDLEPDPNDITLSTPPLSLIRRPRK